ncbi:hypothetical protein D3C72_2427860 [compost metagenome]
MAVVTLIGGVVPRGTADSRTESIAIGQLQLRQDVGAAADESFTEVAVTVIQVDVTH